MKKLFNMHQLCVVKVRANVDRTIAYATDKEQESQIIATSQKQKLPNIDSSWLFSNYMQCSK